MALIAAAGALAGVALFAIIFAAFGRRCLRWWQLSFASELEDALLAIGCGVILYETGLALTEYSGHIRIAVIALLVAVAVLGAPELPGTLRGISGVAGRVAAGSRIEHLLAAFAGVLLLAEALIAVAPLTGSDALHYHFAAPLLTLRNGFRPDFFLAHSFFVGQGHLLILTALALGGEKLALGLIFLGGALAAAAGACLARRFASRECAWLCALIFLLTPVVFWQIGGSGAPDIWMALFATLGVLVIAQFAGDSRWQVALLAGLLAGALAGTKYTGCTIAAALAIAYFAESRSLRRFVIFFTGALGAGVWPYFRNALWTGDPVFPFLTHWLAPSRTNAFALAAIRADTGAAGAVGLREIFAFPLFAAFDPVHAGFWQFLGPLVLALAPFLLLAVRKTPLWRVTLVVWILGGLLIGAISGMPRFLLPLLPIATAAVLAGVDAAGRSGWRIARGFAIASIASFLLLGFCGLFLYGRTAALATIGLIGREEYLRERAPDYQEAEFVNQVLQSQTADGNALVFFRHVYYLRVPYLYGDPDASWAVDPSRLGTPEAWRDFLRASGVRWLVREASYPAVVAAPLKQLEDAGALTPIARTEISGFVGLRLTGERAMTPVVVLRVND